MPKTTPLSYHHIDPCKILAQLVNVFLNKTEKTHEMHNLCLIKHVTDNFFFSKMSINMTGACKISASLIKDSLKKGERSHNNT